MFLKLVRISSTLREFRFYIHIAYIWCCLQKIMFFETNCQKCQFKFVSFWVQDQKGLETKIRNYSWTRFNANNLMVVLDLTNELLLKITFFKVLPDFLNLREISIT